MFLPRSFFRSLPALLLWLAAAAATAAPGVGAARWTGLSDTLFKHHNAPELVGATAFAQDGSGYLWVGGQGGLARWDGYRLRHHTADPHTPGSLPDSYILTLHVDDRGRLWVGTNAGGLARYDADLDSFVVVPTGPGGSVNTNVMAIAGDGNGGLWVGTGTGLDHIDSSGVPEHTRPGAAAPNAIPEGGVQALLRDHSGALWVGTPGGLLRRGLGAPGFAAVQLDATASAAPAVTQLYEDSAGRIWVGTRSDGAYIVEAGSARVVRESAGATGLQTDRVMAIVEAAPGQIWLGTDGRGIVAIDMQGAPGAGPHGEHRGAQHGAAPMSTRRIRHQAGAAASLNDDDIFALFRDRSGLVWVASNTAMSQHDPQQQAVTTLLGGTARPEGISHANVPYVLPMADGRIWLSVGDGGVDIMDPTLGRVGQLRPDPTRPLSALPKGRVLTMAAGPGGAVYLGTQHGLYRSDAHGRRVTRLSVPTRNPGAAVWALNFDAGVLWLGGLDGLWALDLGAADQPALRRREDTRLGDPRVTTIVRGRGASLWVGTRAGLAHLDLNSGAIEAVPTDATDPSRLPPGLVGSMLLDARGRLWVSSFGSGVSVLERRDPDGRLRFRSLGLREGLPHKGVDKILEDTNGDIWASTDDGLAVIDGRSLRVRALQRPQGVEILSYWTNSGAVSAAGELLFGGQGGLSVVRPDRLTRWTQRPPVVVTDARVGAAPWPAAPASAAGAVKPAPAASAVLEVSPQDRGFWVEFAALDLSAPERNRYAYRLQGFDADWIATEPAHRRASYTNLPPGDYTLQLRGSNRDGVWSEPPLQIPVHVQPAWYQTLWLRGVAALCGLGLVGALVQMRTLYLRRRQRELQGLVAERTAELERRSAELRESQRHLEEIAYADPLTGLPNRRLFNDDLRHRVALAVRDGGPFTLLLIDLDDFKSINDTLGHDAGDAMLMETATRLTRAVREADRVARMGGDEFAVLLTQTCEREAVDLICGRIVESLSEPVLFKGTAMRVSASIGAALCPSQGTAPDALYKAADVALYEAKRDGRNTWRWCGGQITSARPGERFKPAASSPPPHAHSP